MKLSTGKAVQPKEDKHRIHHQPIPLNLSPPCTNSLWDMLSMGIRIMGAPPWLNGGDCCKRCPGHSDSAGSGVVHSKPCIMSILMQLRMKWIIWLGRMRRLETGDLSHGNIYVNCLKSGQRRLPKQKQKR